MSSTSTAAKWAAAHADPHGVGDARPTAFDVIKEENLIGQWSDKVILITGASAGIGVETARALHRTGAHLFLPVRDLNKGEGVVKDIVSSSGGQGGKIDLLQLDLESLESVRQCAAEVLKRTTKLNILILNAGVMATPEGRTKDGFETQFGTNHVAHFLLFQLLLPTLLSSSTPRFNSRVVSVSSSGHQGSPILFDDYDLSKGGYSPWKAYGQAKTANIYLANEIDRRYGSKGLHATSLMPGGINTGLQVHVQEMVAHYAKDPKTVAFMKSAEQGAATTVWAAVSKEWEGRGGKYLEDCEVALPKEQAINEFAGYAPHAYDVEAAKRLYDESFKMVGLEPRE